MKGTPARIAKCSLQSCRNCMHGLNFHMCPSLSRSRDNTQTWFALNLYEIAAGYSIELFQFSISHVSKSHVVSREMQPTLVLESLTNTITRAEIKTPIASLSKVFFYSVQAKVIAELTKRLGKHVYKTRRISTSGRPLGIIQNRIHPLWDTADQNCLAWRIKSVPVLVPSLFWNSIKYHWCLSSMFFGSKKMCQGNLISSK